MHARHSLTLMHSTFKSISKPMQHVHLQLLHQSAAAQSNCTRLRVPVIAEQRLHAEQSPNKESS